jgi:hypothetical protein
MGGAPALQELAIASPKKIWGSNKCLLLIQTVHAFFVY